jgi:hypothetical protein
MIINGNALKAGVDRHIILTLLEGGPLTKKQLSDGIIELRHPISATELNNAISFCETVGFLEIPNKAKGIAAIWGQFRDVLCITDKGRYELDVERRSMQEASLAMEDSTREADNTITGFTAAAAKQGDAPAQFTLGLMYDSGDGVPQDHSEAAKWYRLAAEQGHDTAQYALGLMYATGEGVSQDYSEAAKWYHLAAEQGIDYAQNSLGTMYARGDGVQRDFVQAYKWLTLSASQGNTGSIDDRDIWTYGITPDQIAEAERLAREWKPKQQ